MTYTLDLYRRDADGTESLLAYLSAVSVLPTRRPARSRGSAELVKQFAVRRPLIASKGRAIFLIGLGLPRRP